MLSLFASQNNMEKIKKKRKYTLLTFDPNELTCWYCHSSVLIVLENEHKKRWRKEETQKTPSPVINQDYLQQHRFLSALFNYIGKWESSLNNSHYRRIYVPGDGWKIMFGHFYPQILHLFLNFSPFSQSWYCQCQLVPCRHITYAYGSHQ